MGKKANKTNEEKYEDLLESVSSLSDEEDTIDTDSEISSSSGLEGLQKRARELKRRFLLHKNHADRHNLKKICEDGLKVVKKITTVTGKIDLYALEDDLDNAEVDLDLCEQEFQKDISRYDDLLQLLNEHELPKAKEQDFMLKIKNAKFDIYNVTDSPEDLQSEYTMIVSQKEELVRLRRLLSNELKTSKLSGFPQVKKEIREMIDNDLTIDNMDKLSNDISCIIERCEALKSLYDQSNSLREDLDDCLEIDKEFLDQIGSIYLNSAHISEINQLEERLHELKSELENRIQYKKEHPVEIGDMVFDHSRSGAERWYKIAADKGDKYAMYRMYLCNKRNVDYLQKSAELSYPEACYYMGIVRKESKNYSDAFKWYKKGAELGNPDAQYAMGCFYRSSYELAYFVKRDLKEAAKWFMRAAEQGFVSAMHTLAIYEDMQLYITKAELIEMLRKKAWDGDQYAASCLNNLNVSGW